ncbi:hypothetical protein BLNAU_16265 [Blattamonas nauphoetae]|uniref:Uncharacterized protein n=1 Tax=Blattamonas nauphoetae TaxID=2049346 RepID=A0ABQ9XBV1_9EUKA|nr:hypothetical protein BLNAU_16265 [Blattamonas nauphoetae]
MPLITLTMSLGANEVKTARKGEPSYIFVNQNPIDDETTQIPCDYDEQSCEDGPLDPIGKASITINRKHRPSVRIPRDTFFYTYDVMMCTPKSESKIYDPDQVFQSQELIGELKVPSIHHFPHFFKLFMNEDDQIENRLRGTTWHIVDDFTLHRSKVNQREHVVLLTSPNKKRWEKITKHKEVEAPIMMNNVPTLLFPEMIHIFNAIPCPFGFRATPASMICIES